MKILSVFVGLLLVAWPSFGASGGSIGVKATLARADESAFVFRAEISDLSSGTLLTAPAVTLQPSGHAKTSTTAGEMRVVIDVTTNAPAGTAEYTVDVFRGGDRIATQSAEVSLK